MKQYYYSREYTWYCNLNEQNLKYVGKYLGSIFDYKLAIRNFVPQRSKNMCGMIKYVCYAFKKTFGLRNCGTLCIGGAKNMRIQFIPIFSDASKTCMRQVWQKIAQRLQSRNLYRIYKRAGRFVNAHNGLYCGNWTPT